MTNLQKLVDDGTREGRTFCEFAADLMRQAEGR